MLSLILDKIIGSRVEITVLMLYCLAVLYWRSGIQKSHWYRFSLVSLSLSSLFALMILLSGSVIYLLYGSYYDHIEPSISVIAELFSRNHPLYHSIENDEKTYSLLYGPLIFQITALSQYFLPTVMGSKLPAFFAFWGACIVMVFDYRNIHNNKIQSIAIFTLAGFILLSLGYHNYWNRPDPYLLLCTALSVFAYLRLPSLHAAIIIGAIAGIAAGFKIHAPLYIVPIAFSLVFLHSNRNIKLRILFIGLLSAAVCFILPFLFPNVSLAIYLDYLFSASKHGLSYPLFLTNIKLAAVLCSPALMLLVLRKISMSDRIEVITIPFVISVLCTAIVAAKSGSGPHHLLPFIPVSIILGLHLLSLYGKHALVGPILFSVIALMMSLHGMREANAIAIRGWNLYDSNLQIEMKTAELDSIHNQFPNAEMGIGGVKKNGNTFLRVYLILKGGKTTVEFSPWMDLQFSGISKNRLDPLTVDCKVPQWIIPKNSKPFSLPNVFLSADSDEKIVSDNFISAFDKNYELVYSGSYYEVWNCNF